MFFDTSVLLPGLVATEGMSSPARQLMRAVIAGEIEQPQTAWHCCLEFFAVSTRLPEELRLSPEAAELLIGEEILARFEVCELPNSQRLGLFGSAAREGLVGGRIYDSHIAEIARLAGANAVVTGNRRHFVALLRHGVRVLTASEALEALGT